MAALQGGNLEINTSRSRSARPADPTALVIVRKEGYSDLVAKCPCAGMTYAVSPFMDKLDGIRIVLNWGARPVDLDGHIKLAARFF